jgi:vacuolar-type H+-ATPase subunit E/Vma4
MVEHLTIEEKLAHFMDAAVQENTTSSQNMLDTYQASLDEQFEAYKARIEQQAAAEVDAELESIRREGNKQLAHEHLVIKRALSQKYTELQDKLFDELNALLDEYKKSPEYPKLLARQICRAKEFAREDPIAIYLDPEDAPYQEALEKETGVSLVISQYSFGGGTRAVISSRHILIDNSFDSRIAEQKETFHFNGGELK